MFIRTGAITIGMVLIIGQRFFSDYTIMWFASPDPSMSLLREVMIIVLIAMAIIRPYFDTTAYHMLAGLFGLAILGASIQYFISNPAYLFDTLLLMITGISFSIDALQRIPVEFTDDRRQSRVMVELLRDTLHLRHRVHIPARLHDAYFTSVRDDSHVLFLS